MRPEDRNGTAIAVLVLLLAACSGSEAAGSSPTGPPATYASLSQRPVSLPAVSPGLLCPVSRPVGGPKKPKGSFVPNGFGEGPVYLTGEFDMVWFSGESVRLTIDPAYSDIVLVRGHQLNGRQGMPLVATPPGTSPNIEIPAAPSTDGRQWAGQIVVSGPGCFGLQVDGATFEEGIVFEVQPGTPRAPLPG